MHDITYFCAKVRNKLRYNNEKFNDFFRKHGVTVGERVLICTNILTSDSYLIEIGNDVVISIYVHFVTHDYSIKKVLPEKANLFGKIRIGDNCFIGEGATLLYGVNLAPNIIVASGAVVTKSFDESYIIIGGNPAKKIGDWSTFRDKYYENAVNLKNVEEFIKKKPEILVER